MDQINEEIENAGHNHETEAFVELDTTSGDDLASALVELKKAGFKVEFQGTLHVEFDPKDPIKL